MKSEDTSTQVTIFGPATSVWKFRVRGGMQEALSFYHQFREQQRARYSARVGFPLTQEQADAIDRAAAQLAQCSLYSFEEAHHHILNLIQASYAQERMRAALDAFGEHLREAFEGVIRIVNTWMPAKGNVGIDWAVEPPPHPKWWHGLEHVIQHHTRTQAHARMHRPNTRGRYRYGSAPKAQSYWRHTAHR